MNKLLIIGYGNILRGDDGIGWYAAQLLAERLPYARVITTHQLTPELAESVSQSSFVLFLDAFAGGEPGVIRCEHLIPDSGDTVITHHATPTALLSMSQHLYGRCPPAVILSLGGLAFEISDTLSPLMHHMLPSLVDEACEIIHQETGLEVAQHHAPHHTPTRTYTTTLPVYAPRRVPAPRAHGDWPNFELSNTPPAGMSGKEKEEWEREPCMNTQ